VLDRARADALREGVAEHHPQGVGRGECLQVALMPGLGVRLDLVPDQPEPRQQTTGQWNSQPGDRSLRFEY
jgi:hypothetical protein